jgi:hypothetical protein
MAAENNGWLMAAGMAPPGASGVSGISEKASRNGVSRRQAIARRRKIVRRVAVAAAVRHIVSGVTGIRHMGIWHQQKSNVSGIVVTA